MSLRRPLPLPLCAAALMVASAAVSAGPHGGRPAAPPAMQQQPRIQPQKPQRQHADDALSDSVRRIERSTRGQVLSAERVPYDGRNVNRIKVVDQRGRVRVYMDDPQARPPQQPDPPTRGDDD